jgi:hypothetical protein
MQIDWGQDIMNFSPAGTFTNAAGETINRAVSTFSANCNFMASGYSSLGADVLPTTMLRGIGFADFGEAAPAKRAWALPAFGQIPEGDASMRAINTDDFTNPKVCDLGQNASVRYDGSIACSNLQSQDLVTNTIGGTKTSKFITRPGVQRKLRNPKIQKPYLQKNSYYTPSSTKPYLPKLDFRILTALVIRIMAFQRLIQPQITTPNYARVIKSTNDRISSITRQVSKKSVTSRDYSRQLKSINDRLAAVDTVSGVSTALRAINPFAGRDLSRLLKGTSDRISTAARTVSQYAGRDYSRLLKSTSDRISTTARMVSQYAGRDYSRLLKSTSDRISTTTRSAITAVSYSNYSLLFQSLANRISNLGTSFVNVIASGYMATPTLCVNTGAGAGNYQGVSWTGPPPTGNTYYATYMASSGATNSWTGGTACSGYNGLSSSAIRNRSNKNIARGFIWENVNEECLASLNSYSGEFWAAGTITTGGDLVCPGTIYACSGGVQGNGNGVSWYASGVPNTFGTYLAQSGGTRSWVGAAACNGVSAGLTNWAVRHRIGPTDANGFIVENSNETCLFSVSGLSGNVYTLGTVTSANSYEVLTTGVGSYGSIRSCPTALSNYYFVVGTNAFVARGTRVKLSCRAVAYITSAAGVQCDVNFVLKTGTAAYIEGYAYGLGVHNYVTKSSTQNGSIDDIYTGLTQGATYSIYVHMQPQEASTSVTTYFVAFSVMHDN